MLKKKYLILLISLLFVGAAGAFAWRSGTKRRLNVVKPVTTAVPTSDTASLRKLLQYTALLDWTKKDVTFNGDLTIDNPADTTQNIKQEYFVFSKKGQDYYYKQGRVEIINRGQLYICIDHSALKVIIAPHQQIEETNFPGVKELNNLLGSESYQLKTVKRANSEIIQALNETHVTCKEYSLTYDTVHHAVRNIFMRMTYFPEPFNRKLQKTLNLNLVHTAATVKLEGVPPEQVVMKQERQYHLTADYKRYELIVI